MRCSTPYKNEARERYREFKQNQEKWLNKKGFDSNFGKLDIERRLAIPNYVFISPPKIPIYKYNFRDVKKDKWITPKEFLYKNSNDLVL